jgi:Leucine-rich repeat (LRR) protein
MMNLKESSLSFKSLCTFFNINTGNFEKSCEKFNKMEIFMLANFSKIQFLDNFKNLTELSIINQNIKKIENLDILNQLEILRINENPNLTKIEGLNSLINLKKLFLFYRFFSHNYICFYFL